MAAADLVLRNGAVHTLEAPDRTAEAVAVRDGRIVHVGSDYRARFIAGVETRVIDLDGRPVLPGFVDAHTHMTTLGRYRVHADLRDAAGPDECVARLRAADDGGGGPDRGERADGEEWILGFGFDESGWGDPRYLDRSDIDRVSRERPVAAFREDMHVAAVNGVALSRLADDLPADGVRTEGGDPTGVLVEGAVEAVYEAIEPGPAEARDLLLEAQSAALARGVTCVHDMVRRSHAPRAYRDLAREGELALRVRLNYWRDHLDALIETGLRTGHGGDVAVGAIKTYTDGSLGGRTAKLSEPYADGGGDGEWVVPPADLADLAARADAEGFQVAAHAIGDRAVTAALDAFEGSTGERHRIEHAELLPEGGIDRLADLGVVVSAQPNFLKWAGEGGLYDARLGERWRSTNRFRDLSDAGVPLAFGSDCMPLDPLFGVHYAVNAPVEAQRLSVTEALRAYTWGGAYAGFDESRLGTVAVGKRGDLVVLARSPWQNPDEIEDIDVDLTVAGGTVVHDGR